MPPLSDLAGVVLCGGHSSRMGFDKAWLPFGEEYLLQRVVRLLGEAADPIAVVAAADQQVPDLPDGVVLVRDRRSSEGPLEGIARGLEAIGSAASRAYVTACDTPFLTAKWVRHVARLGEGYDACIPRDGRFHHPLAAVYGVQLVAEIEKLLESGQRRPIAMLDICRTLELDVESLRATDPELQTLNNLNNPQAYKTAMQRLGLEVPSDVLRQLSID